MNNNNNNNYVTKYVNSCVTRKKQAYIKTLYCSNYEQYNKNRPHTTNVNNSLFPDEMSLGQYNTHLIDSFLFSSSKKIKTEIL